MEARWGGGCGGGGGAGAQSRDSQDPELVDFLFVFKLSLLHLLLYYYLKHFSIITLQFTSFHGLEFYLKPPRVSFP